MSQRLVLLASVAAITAVFTGCPPSEDSAKPADASAATASGEPTPADHEQAVKVFGERCSVCHGPRGAGDGPASSGLEPKPRNFTDAAWQTSVTDEYIEKIVKYGGSAVGKSAAMPGNPDLANKAGVIAAMRLHVRSLKAN